MAANGRTTASRPAGTRHIVLAINSVNSYGREVIRGVMEFCQRNPHWDVGMEPPWTFGREPLASRRPVDGIIVQLSDPELFEWVRAAGRPMVDIAHMRAIPDAPPTVCEDDEAIGEMAADHLLSLGFPHYAACISGDILFGRLRRDAFVRRVVAATGRAVAVCEVGRTEPMTAASADDLARLDRWLDQLPKPTAVFCANDARALQVLSAARRLGIGVPDEVAVLGVGDDELANLVGGVPLSSVAIPSVQVGFTAASILEGMLDGTAPRLPAITRLAPLCVVPRASTDVTFTDDPDVAAAVRFIRANAARPIAVPDVTADLAIGRRSLERRFRSAIGWSVATEIRRVHVERAKQLLASSRLTIEEVAEASGFTSATLLGVAFRKSVGRTPTAYRREVTLTQPKRSPAGGPGPDGDATAPAPASAPARPTRGGG